jgi:CheY-like chemotaxis protein
LVVDDSRSARISLQKLLEKYHIAVDFAESGEEALDYLKHHLVDVIFMDHSMPGMDGLETVVAIKSNPRTATIPVMMYTATEGEVYVSQARALGAIGVLPKQVQPGVLLEMLRKLGLVREEADARPSAAEPREPAAASIAPAAAAPAAVGRVPVERPPPSVTPSFVPPVERAPEPLRARFEEAAVDREYDQQALGASVQALVTRVLNEQHLKLRSDILTSHRDFARQVAAEIFAKERAAAPPPGEAPPAPGGRGGSPLLTAVLAVVLVLVGALYWYTRTEGERLNHQVAELEARVQARDATIESLTTMRTTDHDAALVRDGDRHNELVGAVQWALNQGSLVGFDELAFGDRRALELEALLEQLTAAGFRGRVRLESHLGEFCLALTADGEYVLAAPGMSVDACSRMGHPLDGSSIPEERQSTAFASFLAASPLVTSSGIEVEIVAHDRESSVPAVVIPSSVATAGEWNDAARRNNRVQYRIIAAYP